MDTEIEATQDADSREIQKGGCVLYSQNGKTYLYEGTPGAGSLHIVGKSSPAEHIHFKSLSSDAESTESRERMQIEETSAAAEQTEIEVTFDADSMQIEGTSATAELTEIEETSAAAEQTEIEVTSDADAVLTAGTSASKHTVASAIYHYIFQRIPFLPFLQSLQIKGTSAAIEDAHIEATSGAAAEQTEIEVTSDADALRIEGTSAEAGQTGIEVTSDTDAVVTEGISISNLYHYIFGPFTYLPYQQFPEIIGTSAATELTHIEATSGAVSLQIQGQSFPVPAESMKSGEILQIEETSATDAVRNEGTSAAAEDTEIVERTQWPINSIFHAPAPIKYYHEQAFQPKLVSIGPYYHGLPNLQRMERLKSQCIPEIEMKQKNNVRERSRLRPLEAGTPSCRRSIYNVPDEPSWNGEINIPHSILMESAKKARAHYKEKCKFIDVDFVRILFMDSCFIIRTILSLSQPVQESMAFLDVNIKDIRSDLLILENQIPLFFIRKVYELLFPVMSNESFTSFNAVLEPFICLDMPWTINHEAMKSSEEPAHLLDLYWRCSLSPKMYKKLSELERNLCEREKHGFEQEQPTLAEIHLSSNAPNNAPKVIANATELNKMVGIEFEKFNDKGHFIVTFSKPKGIIRMPRLKIDTRQKNLLINLIAFENCILPCMRTFSCYVKLMDALIDSENDVMFLQQCGVIYNTLKSHEDAATFFNDIGNFCFIDYNTNHFSDLYKDVQEYYCSSRRRRWASFQQKYFSSPWARISLFAAGFLLILSVAQTFYAIYGYHKPMK